MICFCLIIRFSVFFQCFLLSFLFPMCFYIFHLAKLLLALDTPIVIPVNLIFFLIQVQKIVLTIMEPINLLACLIYLILQAIFCIIHPLRKVFYPCNHGVHDMIRLWSFKAYKLDCSIHSLSNFSLIMVKSLWRTGSICAVDCGSGSPAKYDSALGLQNLYSVNFQSFIYICRISLS